MMSLAKSNLKASNGNEAPPPVAPPQGRPARSAKPVDAHSNDKVSALVPCVLARYWCCHLITFRSVYRRRCRREKHEGQNKHGLRVRLVEAEGAQRKKQRLRLQMEKMCVPAAIIFAS